MTRGSVTALIVVAALIGGCSNDPPSAAVGIQVRGCDPGVQHGSGMFVDTDAGPLVLTSAHVLKGAQSITVTRGDERAEATIVAFDPQMDLAHLAVDGMAVPFPWTVDSTGVTGGESGSAYVVRDGRVVTLPVTVERRINIRTEDIYVDRPARREWVLFAAILGLAGLDGVWTLLHLERSGSDLPAVRADLERRVAELPGRDVGVPSHAPRHALGRQL